jgi:hypothetical protein
MFGCEVIFATDTEPVTAVGCIFNDGSIYVHEPVCDMWASIPDMLAERTDVTGFQVIGPVVPLEMVKAHMAEQHKEDMKFMREHIQAFKSRYEAALASLAVFDEYNNTPINFNSKLAEPITE